MHLNELDGIILLLVFVSGMIGILRGLVKEILQLASIALSVFCAIFFRKNIAFLFGFITSDFIKEIISGTLIFIILCILGNIAVYLICQTIKMQGVGKFIDKILGFNYGLARGVLVIMLGIMLIENNHNVISNNWWQNSILLEKIQHISTNLSSAIPRNWIDKIHVLVE